MSELSDYIRERESEIEKVSSIREHLTKTVRTDNQRQDSDIDYARVLYSSSFRRLQGKMQLLVPGSLHFHRNRLTHSLEVAQIAHSIARKLNLKDLQTVQTCSLAHDIGNPPFGHAGEIFLSNCFDGLSYEGNAQTFRVLTHLEEKHHSYNGLNLTLRTILGTVKYPFSQKQNNKKYLYDEDYQKITKWQSKHNFSLKSLDCEIMDLADEIAYAAHDLEDSLRFKYFTIGELLHEFQNSEYKDVYVDLTKIIGQARNFANKAKTYETSEEYSILFKKELTSLIVDTLITDIGLVTKDGKLQLGYKTLENLAIGLKKLTFKAIKRSPTVIEYELKGKIVLKGLFDMYMDESFNRDLVLLPAEWRQLDNKERTIVDYIGGMMDEFAIHQYKKYYGQNSLDQLYKKSS
jgi:dGTPase